MYMWWEICLRKLIFKIQSCGLVQLYLFKYRYIAQYSQGHLFIPGNLHQNSLYQLHFQQLQLKSVTKYMHVKVTGKLYIAPNCLIGFGAYTMSCSISNLEYFHCGWREALRDYVFHKNAMYNVVTQTMAQLYTA